MGSGDKHESDREYIEPTINVDIVIDRARMGCSRRYDGNAGAHVWASVRVGGLALVAHDPLDLDRLAEACRKAATELREGLKVQKYERDATSAGNCTYTITVHAPPGHESEQPPRVVCCALMDGHRGWHQSVEANGLMVAMPGMAVPHGS